ncbi:hypothetical protein AZE42_01566 [Rhizopogon vesiculosus]|uniref:Uncharacterized protein n=1 Tax=Rhizopogon vesiculosus TaxID=180088 RepID=A0A1J8Q2V2_9AGAM|nr:hypothetical protein AZE42_01566 [Rhizopogon vesiculosus]
MMNNSYAPPKLFPMQWLNKEKELDRPADVSGSSWNLFPWVTYSCTPSITDHEMGGVDHSDSDDDLYLSVKSDDAGELMDVEDSLPHNDAPDLVQSINGMYRVLDLISEQGSGGLVDKIIIAQDSFRAFVNSVCPGTYVSITKVNFSALDRFMVKPVGVYGSKGEIVRLLTSLGVIDERIAGQLITNQSDSSASTPSLRSGLYIVRTSSEVAAAPDQQLFLIYWPEDQTWDDSAPSSVRRNRVTFMRYLTKMCDQVTALISPEHAKLLKWNKQECEDTVMDVNGAQDESSDSSRMITFEVTKTNEREEAVKWRPGFAATYKHIAMPLPHPDVPEDVVSFEPAMLHGETAQGFVTIAFRPGKPIVELMGKKSINRTVISNYLEKDALRINEDLDANALEILIYTGILERFRPQCERLQQELAAILSNAMSTEISEEARVKEDLKRGEPRLTMGFHKALIDAIVQKIPTFTHGHFPYALEHAQSNSTRVVPDTVPSTSTDDSSQSELDALVVLYPEIGEELYRMVQHPQFLKIPTGKFKDLKERICIAQYFLRHYPDAPEDLIDIILQGDIKRAKETLDMISNETQSTIIPNAMWSALPSLNMYAIYKTSKHKEADPDSISDAQFLAGLEDIKTFCVLENIVEETRAAALEHFGILLSNVTKSLVRFALDIQVSRCLHQVRRKAASIAEEQRAELRRVFINEINNLSEEGHRSHTFVIDSVKRARNQRMRLSRKNLLNIIGSRQSLQQPMFEFSVHLMQLTEHDQHSLKMDSSVIPSPKFTDVGRQSHSFKLPPRHSVARAQLLSGDRIFLATTDQSGNLTVFLETLTAIEFALARDCGKKLNRDKIGDFILAFDESKRILCVIAREKLLLHIFVHDDTRGFQASGSAINLNLWYGEGTSIVHGCFVCGSDELLLVDSLAQARIYSLTTMQFRPATLNLNQIPTGVYSTPDGSCLIVTHVRGSDLTLTAYHWSTFGSTDGITLDIPDLPLDQPLLLTSLINRNIVHLVTLDINANSYRSFALDITRKVTEFTFKEKGVRGGAAHPKNVTLHNCLINCHTEVWTRFPVLPAVQRETITSSSNRCLRTLVFITDRDHQIFVPHFHDLIAHFEKTSKKPTGNILKSIVVSATTYAAFANALLGGAKWSVSKFRAGEWLAEFLCLIPIQIAVTKENRFIPLKDGVYSTELEKSLLGADVNRIVDFLSFG